MPFRPNSSFSGGRFARFVRTLHSAWPRVMHAALPNLCALCGNLSHKTLCAGCDEAYWNESRLRCTVCAVPLSSSRRAARTLSLCGLHRPSRRRSTRPSPSPTIGRRSTRLAVGLKFRARLMLAREFAQRLARLAQDAWQDAR